MTLLNTASAVRLGSASVSALYAGDEQVWPPVPRRLPGLAVWLDASQLGLADGADVPNLPNLAPGGVQGSMQTDGPLPKLKAADTPSGLPCVRFSTSQAGFRMTGTGVTTSGTLSYVARVLNMGNPPGRVISSIYPDSGSNWIVGFHGNYYDWFYDNSTSNTGKSWDANGYLWKLYTGDWDTSAGDHLWEHGNLIAGFGFGTGPEDDFTINGYGLAASQETCDCEVCEVVMYDRVLTDPERQQVESYLMSKWLPPVPKQVPGLLFWLDASQLPGAVDSLVTTWPDLSGNGHNCTAISADKPALRTSPNGLLWAAFSGSNGSGMTIAGLGAELSGRNAYSAVYLVNPESFSGYPILMCAPTNAAWDWILELDTTGIYVGVTNGHYRMMTMDVGPLTGASDLVSVTADPSNTRLWMNTNEVTTYTLGPSGDNQWPIPALSADALLGAYFNGNYCWNGRIAEFALYDHVLTNAERQKLESYMQAKWS